MFTLLFDNRQLSPLYLALLHPYPGIKTCVLLQKTEEIQILQEERQRFKTESHCNGLFSTEVQFLVLITKWTILVR